MSAAKRLLPLLALASVMNACVLPLPAETMYSVTEQSVGAIKAGTWTRADVLLSLADPSYRGEQDGYFVYEWEKEHGGFAVLFIFLIPLAVVDGVSCQSLVIRFSPDGTVAGVKRFDGETELVMLPFWNTGWSCKSDTALAARIAAWLAEPLPSAPPSRCDQAFDGVNG